MYVKKIGLFCLILLTGIAFGQKTMTSQTHELNEVVVKNSRLKDFAVGSSVQKIDSLSKKLFSSFSMAELLSNISLVRVNQNGPGGVSNAAIRGGSSAQTAVIWNGVNIQNPSDGGVNLALLPAVFFENIRVQYGGSGTLFGSGASSGAIHLDGADLLTANNRVDFQMAMGSFNTWNAFVGAKIGNFKWANSFKYYHSKSDNNFDYKQANGIKLEQTNAGLVQNAFLNETTFKTASNSTLKATVWYQEYDKDVQTTMSATEPSQAFQEDKNVRLALNWEKTSHQLNIKVKSVYIADEIYYNNPTWLIESTNKSKMWVNEFDAKYLINQNHSVTGGLNFTYDEGESASFASLTTRRRVSAFVSHKVQNLLNVLTVVSSLRQEIVDGNFDPIIPSLGLKADLTENIAFNGNVSRVYRNPTFNELYYFDPAWNSYGNPDLNPEKGWSMDAGFEQTISASHLNLVFKQNFFLNHMTDWIVWVYNPSDFSTVVENKNKGKTIGLDLMAESVMKYGETIFKMTASYTWTQSNFIDVVGEVETESKMTYVPQHRFMLNMSVHQKSWSVLYSHNYFGKRSTGEWSAPLGAYFVGNLSMQYVFRFGKQKLTSALHINNIWNRDYQVIYDYAMPGRSVKLSLKYSLGFNK